LGQSHRFRALITIHRVVCSKSFSSCRFVDSLSPPKSRFWHLEPFDVTQHCFPRWQGLQEQSQSRAISSPDYAHQGQSGIETIYPVLVGKPCAKFSQNYPYTGPRPVLCLRSNLFVVLLLLAMCALTGRIECNRQLFHRWYSSPSRFDVTC